MSVQQPAFIAPYPYESSLSHADKHLGVVDLTSNRLTSAVNKFLKGERSFTSLDSHAMKAPQQASSAEPGCERRVSVSTSATASTAVWSNTLDSSPPLQGYSDRRLLYASPFDDPEDEYFGPNVEALAEKRKIREAFGEWAQDPYERYKEVCGPPVPPAYPKDASLTEKRRAIFKDIKSTTTPEVWQKIRPLKRKMLGPIESVKGFLRRLGPKSKKNKSAKVEQLQACFDFLLECKAAVPDAYLDADALARVKELNASLSTGAAIDLAGFTATEVAASIGDHLFAASKAKKLFTKKHLNAIAAVIGDGEFSWDRLTLVREIKQLFGSDTRVIMNCILHFLFRVGETDGENMKAWAAFFAQQMAPAGQQDELSKSLCFMADQYLFLI